MHPQLSFSIRSRSRTVNFSILSLAFLLLGNSCSTSKNPTPDEQQKIQILEQEAQNLADENLLLRQQLEASKPPTEAQPTSQPEVEVPVVEGVDDTPIEATAANATTTPPEIKIYSVIPNPLGNERTDEAVTLINLGENTVSLTGWVVKDLAESFWKLDGGGMIEPGQHITVRRNGMSMGMNNDGDTVFLINPAGEIVDSLSFGSTSSDEVIAAEK